MGLFRKKKEEAARAAQLARLSGKSLRYVTRRTDGDYEETVIGHGGSLNIREDTVLIVCEEGEVFRRPLSEVTVGELLSNDGATFEYAEAGRRHTVVAYYTYYRTVR